MNNKAFTTKRLTYTAIMMAVIIVLTYLVKFSFKPTGGYLTLADAGVYAASFLLGPVLGGLASGIGTGLADLLGGFPAFMVLTFFAHGLQAVVAGLIGYRKGISHMVLGCVAGTVVMAGIYFGGEVFFMGIDAKAALLELPGNVCQNVAGALVGIPLVRVLRKAYPAINEI